MSKKQTLTLNEFYCGNDLVLFNNRRQIVGWMLYSDQMGEWFSVSIVTMQNHPAKFEQMEEMIQTAELTSLKDAKIDQDIDEARDARN